MSFNGEFTKENLDLYLKELGKEYQKLAGKAAVPCELVLVGGASILANYGYRLMTNDMDAMASAPGILKEAINRVGDKFGLPNKWLNSDFKRTDSYSDALREVSTHYKTFSRLIDVRTIEAEYLIAMKLVSGRQYKSDQSDIVGILVEHKAQDKPISMEMIDKAVCRLYGSWNKVKTDMKKLLVFTLEHIDDPKLYERYRERELESKEKLIAFDKAYPNTIREENIDSILKRLQEKETEK